MHVLHKIFLFLMLLTTSLFKTDASYFEQIRHGIVPNYCDIVIPGLIECIIIMCASSSKKSVSVKIGIVITGSFLNWLLYNYLYSNTRQGILDRKNFIVAKASDFIVDFNKSKVNIYKLVSLLKEAKANDILGLKTKNDFIKICISINEKADYLNKKLSFLNEPFIEEKTIEPFRYALKELQN